MPVLLVYGVPSDVDITISLEKLIDSLQKSVASVPELKLTPDQVTVFFPSDLVQAGLGEEIICFVVGLFQKPDRTPAVRQQLAQKITDTLDQFAQNKIGNRTKIETFVNPFNQRDGFAQSPANQ